MRLGLAIAGLLLAAPGLASCGDDGDGDGDSPATGDDKTSAVSVDDFCAAAEKFENSFTETDTTDLTEGVKALKDAARELQDLGTPEGIPDDARDGLALTLDKLVGLPDDADEDDLLEVLDFSEDEKAKSMAFEEYLNATCPYRAGSEG